MFNFFMLKACTSFFEFKNLRIPEPLQVFTWKIRMRCDRQMFPHRQLLRSTFERGERRGCIWFTQKKKKKKKKKKKRKIENFIAPTSCIVLIPFLTENLRRDVPLSYVVHPYPTRVKRVRIRVNEILISLSSSRW